MELEIKEDLISKEGDKKPIKDPWPINFVDLLEPEKEKISSSREELDEGQSQVVKFGIKSMKNTRTSKKARMNPYIKDLVINKEEQMA